jgi:hypothetical protein
MPILLDGVELTDDNSTYLGDGVFGVTFGAGRYVLVAVDGLRVTNKIYLDDVRDRLELWLKGLRSPRSALSPESVGELRARILGEKVEALFTTRVCLALQRAGLERYATVHDLIQITRTQILAAQAVGQKTVDRVRGALSRFGLDIGMTPDEIDAWTPPPGSKR